MKSTSYLLFTAFVLGGSICQGQDINLTGYTLTFDDEFNSLSATTESPKGASNWFAGPANGATGDFSASNWNISAFSISNGILSDQAYYANPAVNGQHWQSGELSSVDPSSAGFSQQYGYFEIRCQMPNAGEGSWPAFWLDSTSGIKGGQNEEIDVFEWYGVTNTPGSDQDFMQQASHNWNADGSQNVSEPFLYSPETVMPDGQYPWQGFHTYGCQVDPAHITWYIDGVQTNQVATPASYVASPFYLILDYALGGGWSLSGSPFTTDGPSSLQVDWVRVYSLPTVSSPLLANGTYALKSQGSGLALAAAGPVNGSPVVQQAYTSSAAQQWTLTNLGGNVVELVEAGTSEALEDPGYSTNPGQSLDIAAYTGGTNQQWTITSVGNGYNEIVNVYSGLEVNVVGASMTPGAPICQWMAGDFSNAVWTFTSVNPTPLYALTVNNGAGSGSYAAGATVNLTANVPPGNEQFSAWTGDTAAIASPASAATTLTMPAAATSVTATYTATQYELTVDDGSGSGSYAAGATLTVTAGAPPSGEHFAAWTGDTAALANPDSATTTLTMPASAVAIAATYESTPVYALTVNNGTGGGSYAADATATVTANAAPSGEQFASWTGDTDALADPDSATTTLTMPASAVSITATYMPTETTGGGSNLLGNGTYKVVSQSSGLALAASSSAVVQQTYSGTTTQQWTVTNLGSNVVELVNAGTNDAMTVPGSSTAAGTSLDLAAYTGGTNQQWTIVTASNGYDEVVNVHSGLEANVAGNSTNSGGVICQWFAGNYGNGVWLFSPVSSTPLYALTVNGGTGGGSYAAGATATVTANAPPSGDQFSAWTGDTSALANPSSPTTTLTMPASGIAITASYAPTQTDGGGSGGSNLVGDGTYEVVSQSSKLALATTGPASSSSVVQQTYTSAANQQWALTNLGNNVVKLVNDGNNEALEVPGSSTSAGTYLDVSGYSGGTNQQWTLVPGSSGYDEIVNVNSGEEVNVAGNSTASGGPICQWFAGNYGNGVWSLTAVGPAAPTPPPAPAPPPAPTTYILTVNGGTGSGTYAAGTVVTVTATIPAGEQFTAWTGNTSTLASTSSATTTLTMPAAAATVTAGFSSAGTISTGNNSPVSNGTYRIVSKLSGLVLATNGIGNGSPAVQQTYDTAATQQWNVTNLGNGVVRLVNGGSGGALEDPGSSAVSGGPLDISSYTGGTNQQWKIVAASGGTYEIINVSSGLEANDAYNSTMSGTFICQYMAGDYSNGDWFFLAP